MFWYGLLSLITIVLYWKNWCKIGKKVNRKAKYCNLKEKIATGTKIVLKLYFEKLNIMIVTYLCAFVHG